MNTVIEVVAVVLREADRVLIQRRREAGELVSWWEFPGGKRRPGESWAEAARREMMEEVGLEIDPGPVLLETEHRTPGAVLWLVFISARRRAGDARAREGQELAWAPLRRLSDYPMPEPNRELLQRLAAA